MNRYKVLLPLQVDTREGGSFKQGDAFETEFTEDEEATNVASGLLEIVPATYKVLGPSKVFDTEPGQTFEHALTLGEQAHLVDGGFVEKVATAKPTRKKKEE